mgnify:CR=1 FL=1
MIGASRPPRKVASLLSPVTIKQQKRGGTGGNSSPLSTQHRRRSDADALADGADAASLDRFVEAEQIDCSIARYESTLRAVQLARHTRTASQRLSRTSDPTPPSSPISLSSSSRDEPSCSDEENETPPPSRVPTAEAAPSLTRHIPDSLLLYIENVVASLEYFDVPRPEAMQPQKTTSFLVSSHAHRVDEEASETDELRDLDVNRDTDEANTICRDHADANELDPDHQGSNGDAARRDFCDAVTAVARYSINLRTLTLHHVSMTEGWEPLYLLHYSTMTDETEAAEQKDVISCLSDSVEPHAMTTLTLLPPLSASQILATLRRSPQPRCRDLVVLALNHCDLTSVSILPVLRWLEINGEKLLPNLTTLDVSNNQLCFRCMSAMEAALKSGCPSVQTLSLRCNAFEDETSAPLVELLANCRSIVDIDVGHCGLRDRTVIKLCTALKAKRSSLRRLCIDGADISQTVSFLLLEVLLQTLQLRHFSANFVAFCASPLYRQKVQSHIMKCIDRVK